MNNLDPTSHYLGIEVMGGNDTITMTQTVYINQLLVAHQISYCNTASMSKVERLCLAPTTNYFKSLHIDVTAYKRYTRNIQWLA